MIDFDPKMIAEIRKTYPNKIAEDLVSVQPMTQVTKAWTYLLENGMSEEQLIAEGYEPVSSMKLMWRKK